MRRGTEQKVQQNYHPLRKAISRQSGELSATRDILETWMHTCHISCLSRVIHEKRYPVRPPRKWIWAALTTGLFNPSVTNRTPLISYIHGPILKPFGLLIVISGWFCFVYHEPWEVGNYPSKICHEVWTDFGPFGFSPDIEFQILCLSCCLLKSQE